MIEVTITTPISQKEVDAAKYIVAQENQTREEGSKLPTETNQQLKASTEEVLTERFNQEWASIVTRAEDLVINQEDLRQKWRDATQAKRDAALAALA